MNSFSGSLYANPSFIEGASRVLDIGCTLDCYNMDLPSDQLDLLAIHSDWLTVGQDFWAVQCSVNEIWERLNAA